ncbi:MAG: hypothetical protein HYZ81_07800 [Nitrospinae bacterium]|nr:hypothetical protein [Nitrospinota bacterium]
MRFEWQELKQRLAAGESLEVTTGGGSYEVWAEPYANPAVVFYEGHALAYAELERVIDALLEAMRQGEVTCRWVEPRGMQGRVCEQAYRARCLEDPSGDGPQGGSA